MRLNLGEILEIPGGSVPFSCQLDAERLMLPSVSAFEGPVTAAGTVCNSAGALTLYGAIHADMTRICDRCMSPYRQTKDLPVELHLSADPDSGDDPEMFPIEPDGTLELSDALETSFILDMDAKSLCREDCLGLCERCGANLNDGPCTCRRQTDPRLAVLGQLLDKE